MGATDLIKQIQTDAAAEVATAADKTSASSALAQVLDPTKKYVYGTTLVTFDAAGAPVLEAVTILVDPPVVEEVVAADVDTAEPAI